MNKAAPKNAGAGRARRRSREARAGIWHVVITSSFFALVLGANLFVGALFVVGTVQARLGEPDAGARFRTARFTRPLYDGVFCRYVLFDNKSAELIQDKVDLCGPSVRGRGLRSLTAFTWGER
jgi:hypothetical protein